MTERMPGSPDQMTAAQIDAEFAAMMGLAPEELGAPMAEEEIHAGLGHVALGNEVVIETPEAAEPNAQLSAEDEQAIADFGTALDESALSMTPQELEDYYAYVDTTLNPRLEERGLNAVDTDQEERQQEMARARQHAPAIEMARRHVYEAMQAEAAKKQAVQNKKRRSKTTGQRPYAAKKPDGRKDSRRPFGPSRHRGWSIFPSLTR